MTSWIGVHIKVFFGPASLLASIEKVAGNWTVKVSHPPTCEIPWIEIHSVTVFLQTELSLDSF